MSNRVVKVSITAEISSYLTGMDQVAKKTRESASESDKLKEKLEAQRKAMDFVGKSMLAAGGVIAAGLILATTKAAEFDQAMSNVQAATHESADNMALLRDAAIEAGAETVYSAKEAAGAIEELAKAGISTKDIISGGLTGALDLAAAGGLAVADAAGIASTTLQQFGLKGNQASHVADVLAAGAGKAMGDVSDLSMALSQSGTVASQFGLSLEETTGSLAAFASKGLLGSDAGTSFRTMLLRLANPSGEAADKMKELGLQAYDAQGKFVGMESLAGQLQKRLGGLTQEQRNASLAIIFGQDAIRAANILYTEGAKGIANWTKEVNDAGYAGETASTRLDNLSGDLEKLSGAFDTALITIGGAGQGPLRQAVQGVTELVDGFNGLPTGAQTAVYWIGAVTAAGALAGGTFLLAVPKIAAYRAAVELLSPAAQRASRAIGTLARVGAIGAAAGAAAWGVDALSKAIAEGLLPSADKIDNQMRQAKSGVDLFAAALNSEGITNTQQASKLLKDLGGELDAVAKSDFWNPRSTSGTAVTVANKLADIANSGDMATFSAQFRRLASDAKLTDAQMQTFIETNKPLADALTKQATTAGLTADAQTLLKIAMGGAEASTKTASDAYLEQAQQVDGVRDALKALYDQMNAMNGSQQKAISANAAWLKGLTDITAQVEAQKKAYEDANGSLDGFTLTLDENSAVGAQNAAMLAGLAGDAQDAAKAQYDVDQTTMGAKDAADKYAATLADQRQKFIDSAVAAGYNSDEVQHLADKVFALPTSKQIELLVDTAKGLTEAQRFAEQIAQIRPVMLIDAKPGTVVRPGNIGLYAGGGPVYGPGSATSDSIPAWLSNGEHVLTAAEVQRMGGHSAVYALRASVMRGGAPHYAEGGPVYAMPSTTYVHSTPVAAQPNGWNISAGDTVVFEIEGQPLTAVAKRVVKGATERTR